MVGPARPVRPTLRVVGEPASDGPASGARPAAERIAPGPGLDDAQLVEACRRGDASAATALYVRARPVVDVTIARLLGRKDSRFEDLAHVAMMELVRSLASFRGECSLDTWTSRVTAHAVYKELRRRKVEHRVFAGAAAEDDEPSTYDEGSAAEARSVLRRVRMHLGKIDPVKAWTLVLHDVGGYDLKEIAEITGASVAAAQTRLVRGRAELQAQLEADPELADMLSRRGGRR
jgi:RNA polymerase sigma-70 factor (ECF subfamily)